MTIADVKKVAERVKRMRGRVQVGWPAGSVEPGGTSMVTVAAAHVFGTATVPQRDALRPGIEKALPEIRKMNVRNLAAVASGSMDLQTALGRVGAFAVGAVQQEITHGDFVPLKPATIRRKKSSKPLIDSGSMRQGVTFRVVLG